MAPVYLFGYDHFERIGRPEGLLGNWDIFLNVINIEARTGCSQNHLVETLYGPKETTEYDPTRSNFNRGVTRPLCWLGLLWEDRKGLSFFADGDLYKTPLWMASLKLDTDDMKPDLRLV